MSIHLPSVLAGAVVPVATVADLPLTEAEGAIRYVQDVDTLYTYNGAAWSPVAGGGGGSGTVTSVSVSTANGVSGTVLNPTTTPAITLTLGAITPSSVNSAGTITGNNVVGTTSVSGGSISSTGTIHAGGAIDGSNLSGTNTGDQTITLTGDVTGSGTGSFAATVASVGTSSAANVHSAELLANAATSANTASAIVKRDASGNFAAGTVTAALTGTASGNPPNARNINTTAPLSGGGDLSADRTLSIPKSTASVDGYLAAIDFAAFSAASGAAISSLTSDVTASGPGAAAATVQAVGGSSAANVHAAELLANAATASNTASAIVRRDASGNFTAGTITAAVTGTASGNPPNARTISTTAPLTGGGDLSANRTISMPVATGSVDGYLAATDWTAFDAKQSTSEKGIANGYAGLDGSGKVPAAQLPNSLMDFLGAWDAATNTPTLADGTGNSGDVYRVSVAGTQDLGSGPQTFAVGDWVMYNGSIWEHSPGTDAVTSVNGMSGAVTLTTSDISEGSNLYFTDGRAQTATIVQTINSGDTTHASSSDALFTALGGKQATGNYITALTSDVSASGPGSAAATVNTVGGSSAANVHTAELAANAATATNTVSTIVKRDASGNFAATTITAALTGTASGNPPNARSISTTAPLTGGGDLSADRTLSIPVATSSADGYLASADWSTFNGKQAAGNYVTALTGDVTASGPGSAAATLASVGTAGTYVKVTTDAKGRVTSGSASPLGISDGGSGQTTANSALNAFLPTQTGNVGKFLQTNGTDTSWASSTVPNVTQASAGLVASAGQLLGTNTNDTAGSGFVGEIIESIIPGGTPVTVATSVNTAVAFIVIPEGDWRIDIVGQIQGASPGTAQLQIGFSTTPGNTGILGDTGVAEVIFNGGTTYNRGITFSKSGYTVVNGSTDTVFLNMFQDTGNTWVGWGRITATRTR